MSEEDHLKVKFFILYSKNVYYYYSPFHRVERGIVYQVVVTFNEDTGRSIFQLQKEGTIPTISMSKNTVDFCMFNCLLSFVCCGFHIFFPKSMLCRFSKCISLMNLFL
ncbi:hypothetical protein HMI55_003339 [Coelomomyces lativittatus]|nr:hypothetical protein HMI55_003339 [Coelomomyces lativittatus]